MRNDDQAALADAIRASLNAQGFLHHMGASVDEVLPGKVVMSVTEAPRTAAAARLLSRRRRRLPGRQRDDRGRRHGDRPGDANLPHRRIQAQHRRPFARRPPRLHGDGGETRAAADDRGSQGAQPRRRQGQAGRRGACDDCEYRAGGARGVREQSRHCEERSDEAIQRRAKRAKQKRASVNREF